jgi:hypothetical protein
MDRQALLHVALHPRQDLGEETFGVVFRAHDAFDPVAADTIEQLSLLLIATGDTCHPLAIRQLRSEILGLAERQVQNGGLLIGNLHRLRWIEFITDRADAQAIRAGREPLRRKTEAAIGAGNDGHRDG